MAEINDFVTEGFMTNDSVVVNSKGGLFPHSHTLQIPRASILNPPKEGLLLETSEEYSLIFKHKHQVRISEKELMLIKEGKEVVVHDTDKGRHSFTISQSVVFTKSTL